MEEEKIFRIIANKYFSANYRHGVSNPDDIQMRKGLILQEFREAEKTLDIMALYSYFFVNCAQKLYCELYHVSEQDANSYNDSMLLLVGKILESKSENLK